MFIFISFIVKIWRNRVGNFFISRSVTLLLLLLFSVVLSGILFNGA